MAFHNKFGAAVGALALVLSAGCAQDLTVANVEAPDIDRASATPGDVQTLARSAAIDWYNSATSIDPWTMLSVTADAATANFGNFGMRFNNVQPRIPYENLSAGGDAGVANTPWNNYYQTLGEANDALRAFAKGIVLDGGAEITDQYKTLARFAQAGALTHLSLVFDKAFVVDETTDLNGAPLQMVPYADVATAARAQWDAVIAATAGKSYSFDSDQEPFPLSGRDWDAETINRFANTMNALLLAYTPRDAAAAAGVDWAAVLAYADKGIGTGSAGAPFDFTPITDNNITVSGLLYYADEPSWLRVDMKLINSMDAAVPAEYAGASTLVPPSGNGDDRLGLKDSGKDFEYFGGVIGTAARGIYMQSPYAHQRYKYYARLSTPTNGKGDAPYVLAAESDLVKAEALVRTGGSKVLAAQLINTTRVGRGGLTALTGSESDQVLLDAITYERVIETYGTNGFTFLQLRHADQLREGTVRQLPVPAAELETLGLPIYTFGGAGGSGNLAPVSSGMLSVKLPTGRVHAGTALGGVRR